jgi:hypothetical protein
LLFCFYPVTAVHPNEFADVVKRFAEFFHSNPHARPGNGSETHQTAFQTRFLR